MLEMIDADPLRIQFTFTRELVLASPCPNPRVSYSASHSKSDKTSSHGFSLVRFTSVFENQLLILKCLDPDRDERSSSFPRDTGATPYNGRERAPASVWDLSQNYPEHEWARRARSAWGPHWMCEELVGGSVMDSALLLVCKMM